MNWSKVKSCMYYEKAESEGQRGKPKGTLESEIRSATSLRCDIAPGVDHPLRVHTVLSLFFPGANEEGQEEVGVADPRPLPCTPDWSKEGDGASQEGRPQNCAGKGCLRLPSTCRPEGKSMESGGAAEVTRLRLPLKQHQRPPPRLPPCTW